MTGIIARLIVCLAVVICTSRGSSNYDTCEGRFCYKFISEKKIWDEAKNACPTMGGYLAEVKNEQEHKALSDVTKGVNGEGVNTWLGGSDTENEGTWKWVHTDVAMNYSLGQGVSNSFEKWKWNVEKRQQEPNNLEDPTDFPEGEDCLVMGVYDTNKASGKGNGRVWVDVPCSHERFGFTCQRLNPCEVPAHVNCNHGDCDGTGGVAVCRCHLGYEGGDCSIDIDDCQGVTCPKSFHVCHDGINTYTCGCPAGFAGATCETDIDECLSGPCQNGGSCTDGVNSFTCDCAQGYEGDICGNETVTPAPVGDDDDDGDDDVMSLLPVIAAVAGLALVACGITICLCCIKRKKKKEEKTDAANTMEGATGEPHTAAQPETLERDTAASTSALSRSTASNDSARSLGGMGIAKSVTSFARKGKSMAKSMTSLTNVEKSISKSVTGLVDTGKDYETALVEVEKEMPESKSSQSKPVRRGKDKSKRKSKKKERI